MSPFRSRGFTVAALMYAALSLVSTRVPLLHYLGYEFSALIGFAGSMISGLLTIHVVKPVYMAETIGGEGASTRTMAGFKQAVLLNVTLLPIPFLIMLTNAFFVKNCSFLQGFGFFILISAVSVWFGSALGFLCAVHYRFSKIAFFIYCVLLLGYSAATGYFTPAIFSYNFMYGYFPGLTYDEALGISWSLVVFRILTVFVGLLLVWLALLIIKCTSPENSARVKGIALVKVMADPKNRCTSAIILITILIVWYYRGELGFESTSGFIQSKLGATYTTEHFTIYYTRDSYDDAEIKWIAAEHEFRLKQIADAFFVPFHGRIESYIYPSNEAKQRLVGTGTTNIAKPWSGQIHITKQSLDATLKHELVHVLAAPFGLPVIGASLSTGLVEGLAMAVEWDWGNRTPHQYAAAMRKFGVMPDIEPLMLFGGFASQASSVSYVVCGSFCRFLIDRYGMRKMMQVYRTSDYNLAYGRSLRELINEWHGFLGRIQIKDQDCDAIDVIFRRPPIFRKVCARVIAERNIEARKKYDARNYEIAETLYGESYAEGNGYEALGGYLASALHSGNTTVIIVALDSIIMKDHHPAQYLPLFMTIGDAYWTEGKARNANELYTRVRHADLSLGLDESAGLRSLGVNDTTVRASIFPYFMSDANDTLRLEMLNDVSIQHPNHWMVEYLKGRLLLRMRRYKESLDILSSPVLAVADSLLEALRLRMLGYDLFRLQRFQDAKAALWNSLNFLSTEVAVNEVNDWVERCEWMERYDLK